MTEITTMCKECGGYYSVRYNTDELIYQYTEKNDVPIWEPMPNAKVSDLAIPDYLTNYTCFFCDRKLWT
jgi:hypothetical protein